MDILPLLVKEFEQEMAITRNILKQVPQGQFGWKPHEKSMSLLQLCTHLAEIPGWIAMTLNTSEMDFAQNAYKPTPVSNAEELLSVFDKSRENSKAALATCSAADLEPLWTLRSGDMVFMKLTKYEMVRHALGQMIHHRAQLGIYFRLLGLPVPRTYGPSADETGF